jgi:hypothetical protein
VGQLTLEYILDGSTQFIVVNLDNTIEQVLTDAKRFFADYLHGGAITERAYLGQRHAFAFLQTSGHGVAIKGFSTYHFGVGPAYSFDVFCDASHKSTTTDSSEDGINGVSIWHLFEYLHSYSTLTGDN